MHNKNLYTIDENSESTHNMSEISEHRRSRMRKNNIPKDIEVVFQKFDNSDTMMLSPSPSTSRKILNNSGDDQPRCEFKAPAGKLGVALDTVQGCPVVHKIKPGMYRNIFYFLDIVFLC